MKLIALPAFSDNYIWLLHNGREALVVDPGDAEPVLSALQQHRLQLAGVLITHHHGDHVGGLADLLKVHTAPVYAPAQEHMPVPVIGLHDGQSFNLLGCQWHVLEVPGHTAGHIAFYCPHLAGSNSSEQPEPLLFCGDTLFSGGCGRLFEGTASQMHASLSRLTGLPASTKVCCAHEYTLANLRFAMAVDPGNGALIDYHAECQRLRAAGQATLPSTIGLELQINPFLRSEQASICNSARQRDPAAQTPVEVFAAIRQWKNDFR